MVVCGVVLVWGAEGLVKLMEGGVVSIYSGLDDGFYLVIAWGDGGIALLHGC